jgi:hypothetical protein
LVKVRQFKRFRAPWRSRARTGVAHRRAAARLGPHTEAASVRRSTPWDPLVPHRLPPPLPLGHAPCAALPHRADRAAARPLALLPYPVVHAAVPGRTCRRTPRPCRRLDSWTTLASVGRLEKVAPPSRAGPERRRGSPLTSHGDLPTPKPPTVV